MTPGFLVRALVVWLGGRERCPERRCGRARICPGRLCYLHEGPRVLDDVRLAR